MKDLHHHVSSHHSFMYLWIIGAALVFVGLSYSYIASHPQGIIDDSHEGDVRTVVNAFGNELNAVSVLAPNAPEEIERAYGPYVTPELLATWVANPTHAPGRVTSSPWPSHIEIESVTKNDAGDYTVTGRVMLVTSTSDAGSMPIILTVTNSENGYRITSYRENVSDTTIPQPAVVTAKLNETVVAHGVSITPLEVVEDSRCPMDAMCIDQGRARVRVETVDGMGTSTAVVELSAPEPHTTEVTSFWLIEVMPYPMASDPTEPEQYEFTFHVEKR